MPRLVVVRALMIAYEGPSYCIEPKASRPSAIGDMARIEQDGYTILDVLDHAIWAHDPYPYNAVISSADPRGRRHDYLAVLADADALLHLVPLKRRVDDKGRLTRQAADLMWAHIRDGKPQDAVNRASALADTYEADYVAAVRAYLAACEAASVSPICHVPGAGTDDARGERYGP